MKDIYDILIFRLGEESYAYEFEIIPIPPYEFIENNLSLEPYEYFGEINEILGFKVKQIVLYYNADILMRVKITFRGNKINRIKDLLETTNIIFPNTIMFLKMYHSLESDETVLVYQSPLLQQDFMD